MTMGGSEAVFFLIVEPVAPQALSLVLNLQQVFVVLHDDGIFVEVLINVGVWCRTCVRYSEREEHFTFASPNGKYQYLFSLEM